jgi:hypothetical protein
MQILVETFIRPTSTGLFPFRVIQQRGGATFKIVEQAKTVFFFSLKRNSSPFYAIALAKIKILTK